MTARYNAKAGKSGDELSSDVILNTEDTYNRRPTKFTLNSDTFVDDKGNTWNVTIDEKTGKVTATVPNAAEGQSIDGALLNVPVTAHYFEMEDGKEVPMGTRQTEVQFVASGTEDKVEKILEVPFETKVEKDPELKKGEIKVIQEGEVGSKKVTYTIKDSKITDTKEEELKAPQDRLIHVGEGTEDGKHEIKETVEVPYEVEIQFDDSLKPGEQKVTQEGVPGEKTRTTTITIQDGKVTNTQEGEFTETKAPQKKIIKVGANTEGKVEHKEPIPFKYDVQYDPDFYTKYPEATDNYKVVTEGVAGEKTTTWTIKNSQIVEGPTQNVTKQPVDAVIKVGQKDFTGEIKHTENHEIPFEVEYKYSDELEAGQTKVEQKGEKGSYDVEYSQKIKNGEVDGDSTSKKTNEKAAKNEIVVIGTKPVTKVVEKPFNTEYVYDENLEAGETEEVTPGKNGKVTITTTYDKDQKKVVTSETEEAGQNRVVKIGGKTNGTEIVKEEIPFEVEVRKDPSLKKGEWKYATDDEGNELKGEKGEQEKTLTIVNSKVTETSDPTVTKQPKKAVILVGEDVNDGTHTITEEVDVPFETKIEFDDSLKPGEQKVTQEGEPGKKSRDITLTIQDGKVTNTEEGEFTQTKAPKDKIIKVGRNTEGKIEYKEEIPFGYKVEYVDNLKPGEYKIVKPGKVGTKTTTWTIKDSKVVGDPKVERVEPEDALIQVGKGTPDGTHDFTEKKELPFETIIEYDDSLEPGEEKVVQEGKPGEQERTNTIVIENGKVKEIKEGTFETTTEPVNKIVKIGRKKAEDETTKTVEKEIPYETKIIYDDTLDAGFQKIENEGKPGKEKVTITTKIVDGKLVTTETKETITEKEDRVVRIGVKPVVKETELGHDTEYRHNPNLKEGEQKVIEEGSNGKVEYTITFNKEKGKIEVTEKRTEPTNKIVEIGYKTDGKVKVESEIPFEVEIIEDPEMEAGKTEVVQEGELGKKETTITVVNSEEVSRKEDIIKEPVKKIIKVGTKNVCEIPPVNPDKPGKPGDKDPGTPDKPGDKDPENPDKPGDKDPENPDKPGDKDPETPCKPGDKDPGTPGKPGDKDPGTPGEDPKDPDKDPGKEDPKDPEQPGGEDPKDPGKTPENNGKTPENNGKTPENNGKTPENNGKTPGATGQVDGKSTTTNNKTPKRLPKSGSESEIMTLAMSGLLTAAGFIGLKKKRKDK